MKSFFHNVIINNNYYNIEIMYYDYLVSHVIEEAHNFAITLITAMILVQIIFFFNG